MVAAPSTSDDRAGMDTFLDEVRAGLPGDVDAEQACTAVLCTIIQRLTGGEAQDFMEELPPEAQRLVRPCEEHVGRAEPELFGKADFFRRIGHHLAVEPLVAERVAAVVMAAARKHLPRWEQVGVAGQLPQELKELWLQ